MSMEMTNAKEAEDQMVATMERIAKNLDRVMIGIFMCAGMMGLIAFVLIVEFWGKTI